METTRMLPPIFIERQECKFKNLQFAAAYVTACQKEGKKNASHSSHGLGTSSV